MADTKKDVILFAVAYCKTYGEEVRGYPQTLFHITTLDDWNHGKCSDAFDDWVYSMLDAFGLEELQEGVFEPVKPMNTEDMLEIGRSLGFIYSKEFEEVAKQFDME
jgi:hypothetical protein